MLRALITGVGLLFFTAAALSAESRSPSYRIVYVCDLSTSMEPHLAALAEEIMQSITRLTERQRFNIIVANPDGPYVWSKQMTFATNDNIERTARYVEELRVKGNGDVMAAVVAAMGHKPDLVYVLTNRAIANPNDAAGVIRKHDPERRALLVVIGVEPSPETEKSLREFAAAIGGDYRSRPATQPATRPATNP